MTKAPRNPNGSKPTLHIASSNEKPATSADKPATKPATSTETPASKATETPATTPSKPAKPAQTASGVALANRDTRGENPPVTFSPEMLAQIVNELTESRRLIAELMADKAKAAAMPATPAKTAKMSVAGKTEKVIKNELDAIRAFKMIGISNVQPKVNVLTFNKWLERGFRPLEGSKAVRVANLRLWHETQVRPLTKDEQMKAREQLAAYEARRNGNPSLELQ